MFCSTECAKIAHEKYHKFECDVTDCIEILFTKIMQVSLRTCFEALNIFDGNADELDIFLKEIDGVSRTAFDIDLKSDPKTDRMNWLHQCDSLISNEVSFYFY